MVHGTTNKGQIVARVTSDEELDPSLFKDGEKVFIVREKKGEVGSQHYHIFVDDPDLKIETLRQRLKRKYVGNKEKSCKLATNPKNQLQYLFKGPSSERDEGPPEVILNTLGLDIEEYRERYWTDRCAYKDVVKQAKQKALSFRDTLLARVASDKEEGKYGWFSITNIVRRSYEICKETKAMPPDKYLLSRYVEYVKCQLCTDDFYNEMVEDKIKNVVKILKSDF